MSTPSNPPDHRAEDEIVSTRYRQVADENAPEHLDQRILRRARIATDPQHMQFDLFRWLRPMAFVAVVGLSLTLFLEINESVEAVNPATPIGQDSNLLDKAAQAALEQIRGAESLAQQNPGIADKGTLPAMVDPASASNVRREDVSACSSEQRASTTLWWQCIQTLERRGHAEAATREYEALFVAFPAFEAP